MRPFKLAVLLLFFITACTFSYIEKSNPKINLVNTTQLLKIYESSLIIDSRDLDQYSRMHIKDAINYPVYEMTKSGFSKIVSASKKNQFIFYCNIHCGMSSDAAVKAYHYGYKDVYVYEPGIQSLLRSHPGYIVHKKTQHSNDPKILDKDVKYFLTNKQFEAKIIDGYKVIDIRDKVYKKKYRINVDNVVEIDYFKLLSDLEKMDGSSLPNRDFIIIDDFGNMGYTLINSLEKLNKQNFYILQGGMRSWFMEGHHSFAK